MTLYTIDSDKEIGYETNSSFRKFINFFLIPILNSIPANLRRYIRKTNKSGRKIIDTVTTHEAVELLYLYGSPEHQNGFWNKIFFKIWFSTNNPKGLRNRLRMVRREITCAASRLKEKGKAIHILSIAAGSARAVIESLYEPIIENNDVSITFLDKSESAISYSKKLFAEYSFPDNYTFRWIIDKANNFSNYYEGESSPNIIEMVGLMDYFKDDQVIRIFKTIYENLQNGGTLITANIAYNPERPFITKTVGWDMIYRTPEEFESFAAAAGFDEKDIRILYEPQKIHFVMVCIKN